MPSVSQLFVYSVVLCALGHTAVAQKRATALQVSYCMPYVTHMGVTMGLPIDLNKEVTYAKNSTKRAARVQLLPQLSYFTQVGISRNLLLNTELGYIWNRTESPFFVVTSIGAGYLVASQRQETTLHLATGKMHDRSSTSHYLIPGIGFTAGLDPRRFLGYFIKATYGRKMGFENEHAAFFALAVGLIIKMKSK